MHCFELCAREGVEHVGHPLSLDGFDGVVHSRPAGLEGLAAELIPEFLKGGEYLMLLETSEAVHRE